MMQEDEVYLKLKGFLTSNGWTIVGGQPPRGTDHFPVIEIKSESSLQRGSDGSFKPDLIATQKDLILICECKAAFDPSDVAKLRSIMSTHSRIGALLAELNQRSIVIGGTNVIALVAYSGLYKLSEQAIGGIAFDQDEIRCYPATEWSQEVQDLFISS